MEYQVTTQLCDQMSALFQIEFTTEERQNIYLLLKANANLSLRRDKQDFCRFIGPELLEFITGRTGCFAAWTQNTIST